MPQPLRDSPNNRGPRGNEDHPRRDLRETQLPLLGATVRQARADRGLTATALAGRVGVSPSLISQIERGTTAPSLEVLWGVARALDLPVGAFFDETSALPRDRPSANAVVVRADQRKRLSLPNSVTYDLLSPDLTRRIELVWVRLGPGEESPRQPWTHPGEEQMVVIQGELVVWVDGEEFDLAEGDAITMDSARPHRAINRSEATTVVIAAISPPSF